MHTHPYPPDRGDRLRARRLAAGLSTAQLAGRADCGVTIIERIEGGYRPRNSPTLARLYAAIDRADHDREA